MSKGKDGVSVRKIKEMLRLDSLGFSQRKIAASCNVARSTVQEYLGLAKARGLDWRQAEELDEEQLKGLLRVERSDASAKQEPDYEKIHHESQRKGVTLYLLWEEYCENTPGGYSYSQFCRRYKAWLKQKRLSMHQEHKAGEKAFVDYAGMTLPIYDRNSNEVAFEAAIFVGALGLSSYTYCEATPSQELRFWLESHNRMFSFFGGVVEILVPDNLKSGVKSPCRYEPDLNPSYHNLAQHYGTCVIPARVKKAKDKAKVESGVQAVEYRILARLRDRKFYSLAEANQEISRLLTELNDRPTQRFPESRRAVFEKLEKPALKPLPPEPFRFALEKTARVNIDYHLTFEQHFYSVPYQLVGEQVQLKVSDKTVEVFHLSKRVALHLRSRVKWGYTTLKEHMPPAHRAMAEKWSPERLLNWAAKYGKHTSQMTREILASREHPQQAYRSILGLLRLEKTYGAQRLDAACKYALSLGTCSRKSVLNILKTKLDLSQFSAEQITIPLVHENLRGKKYYN